MATHMFGSCLPNAEDGGVGGEFERLGLEGGRLGELLERAGGAVRRVVFRVWVESSARSVR